MGVRPSKTQRSRNQRGSVVVESALALPLFLLLVFGSMEFGLAFRSYLSLTNSTRDAARFQSTLGNSADADYQAIREAADNLDGLNAGAIRKIVVFRATSPQSTTASGALAACRTASVPGLCNTYLGPNLDLNPDHYGCALTSPDRFWCPGDRRVFASDPPDFLGVYIEIEHKGLTGVMSMSRNFSDEFITQLEPVQK